MPPIRKIILATFNRDKVREMRALLGPYRVEVSGLYDVPGASAPPESGQTVFENALLKARAAHDLTGLPAIADDTSLEVDTLGGKPGIYAARFAGPGASYRDNVERLLDIISDRPPEKRAARFRTACVACLPDGRELRAEGVLEGRIAEAPRGEQGFGYDPVFELPDGRTLAEVPAEEKNRISHRAIAMKRLIGMLEL